jgi:hypothetical protein
MDFIQLTPEQRQRFDEDGFLIVRNALDADMVSRLAEEGDQLTQSAKAGSAAQAGIQSHRSAPGPAHATDASRSSHPVIDGPTRRSAAEPEYPSALDNLDLQETFKAPGVCVQAGMAP